MDDTENTVHRDFRFGRVAADKVSSVERAFRVEVWGSDLVIQRELSKDADLAVLQEIPRGPGRVHLVAYLDQIKGWLTFFSPDGKQLASLTLTDKTLSALPGLYLGNVAGDVCLERLRISRWIGEIPADVRLRPDAHRMP